MPKQRALRLILILSLFGSGFSGVLSYRELFGSVEAACPAPGAPGTVFGYPACVYGFFMFLAVAMLAAWGLLPRPLQPESHERPRFV
jgi:uncharacterized membrane protein